MALPITAKELRLCNPSPTMTSQLGLWAILPRLEDTPTLHAAPAQNHRCRRRTGNTRWDMEVMAYRVLTKAQEVSDTRRSYANTVMVLVPILSSTVLV